MDLTALWLGCFLATAAIMFFFMWLAEKQRQRIQIMQKDYDRLETRYRLYKGRTEVFNKTMIAKFKLGVPL